MDGKENGKPQQGAQPLSSSELKRFIDEAIENKKSPYKRVIIGKIGDDARSSIESVYGQRVNFEDIDIDNHSICHAVENLNHNLEREDLLLAVEVINTSRDILLSDEKHKSNDVLVFKKDMDGEITFLTEVRVKNGYLLVFDAWRQKKARSRKRSDAAGGSPELTSKTSFPRNGPSSDGRGAGQA
jgi:hypothetical protein